MDKKYYIHTQTDNISFIETHLELKKRNVKNNKFFLKIYDKSLIGLNPFDEKNLTEEQKVRIRLEVCRNPWYYLREIARTPGPGALLRFSLHRGNLALCFCMLNNYNSLTILPRQHYKTGSAIMVFSWFYLFGTDHSNMIFSNKSFPDSKRNLKILKDVRDNLPKYLISESKDDKDNLIDKEYAFNKNTITAISTPLNETQADKLGRGMTTPLQLLDEFAFLKFNSTVYAASTPAVTKAKEIAKKNNKPYGITVLTTPNDLNQDESLFVKDTMINMACRFDDGIVYDLSKEEIDKMILECSKNNYFYIEFSYKELGEDEEWFENQCRELQFDLGKIKREILLEWTKSSDNAVFSEEIIEEISKYAYNHKFIMELPIYSYWKLRILDKDIDFDRSYIVGVDTASGSEKDSSAITIIDPITLKPVAEFKDNTISTTNLKKVIYELISKFFKNSCLVIERNYAGHSIINDLLETPISKNIYYEEKINEGQKIEENLKSISYKNTKKKVSYYGHSTDKFTRPLMIEILFDVVENEPSTIISKYLYTDIKDLIRNKKGKIEHAPSCHDDSLFSYLIARYTACYGKNLRKFLTNVKGKIDYENHNMLSIFNSQDDKTRTIKRINSVLEKQRNNIDASSISLLSSDIVNQHNIINKENDAKKEKINKSLRIMNSFYN